ncbi:hypothetical protein ON010_g16484 [Phytophthora cinnamomi]|nr:hypothetical protein ON010_g16484 [Phytophthora cinnamomi]
MHCVSADDLHGEHGGHSESRTLMSQPVLRFHGITVSLLALGVASVGSIVLKVPLRVLDESHRVDTGVLTLLQESHDDHIFGADDSAAENRASVEAEVGVDLAQLLPNSTIHGVVLLIHDEAGIVKSEVQTLKQRVRGNLKLASPRKVQDGVCFKDVDAVLIIHLVAHHHQIAWYRLEDGEALMQHVVVHTVQTVHSHVGANKFEVNATEWAVHGFQQLTRLLLSEFGDEALEARTITELVDHIGDEGVQIAVLEADEIIQNVHEVDTAQVFAQRFHQRDEAACDHSIALQAIETHTIELIPVLGTVLLVDWRSDQRIGQAVVDEGVVNIVGVVIVEQVIEGPVALLHVGARDRVPRILIECPKRVLRERYQRVKVLVFGLEFDCEDFVHARLDEVEAHALPSSCKIQHPLHAKRIALHGHR